MTSDAKIGLLLGLIFIFVIAFVINGLPSLRPPVSKVGATTVTSYPEEDFSGVTGRAEKATGWGDLIDQPAAGSATTPASEETKVAVQEPAPTSAVAVPQPPQNQVVQAPSTSTTAGEGVRSSLRLPPLEELLNHLTPTVQSNHTQAEVDLGRTPVAEAPAPVTSSPVAAAPQTPATRPEAAPPVNPADATTRTEARETPKPVPTPTRPVNLPGATIYTVVDGDNLASIAKKVYGIEEGNRVVNIQRIFQANQVGMKSAHQLSIGQKLVIPPLPKTTAIPAAVPTGVSLAKPTPAVNLNKPAEVLPSSLFERVESLAKRAPAAVPAPTPGERLYTVQDGDNLWKIASSQLGAGSRWDEIQKLNADVLADQKPLKVGAKLRLPAK